MSRIPFERRFDDFLSGLYQLRDEEALSLWLLEELPRLIPGDNAIVALHNPRRRDAVQLRLRHPFSEANFLQALADSGAAKDHPIWSAFPDGTIRAKSLSQMMGSATWHEHPLYREFLHKDEVQDHLTLDILRGGGLKVMIGVIRSRRGFRDNENRALTLLGSHFEQAFRNAKEFQARTKANLRNESFAVEHLNTFADLRGFVQRNRPSWSQRIGAFAIPSDEAMLRWFAIRADALLRGVLETQLPPFALSGPAGEVRLRLARNWGGYGFLVMVESESIGSVVDGRLTPREQEVLEWIVQGKTDPEIAVILGIGLYTVKGHVKTLLRKLNAANRTEAARITR